MKAFFVFSMDDVHALIRRPALLSACDTIVGAAHGLDLEPLAGSGRALLRLEDLLDRHGSGLQDISRAGCELVDQLLGRHPVFVDCDGLQIDLNPALRNHLATLLYPPLAFQIGFGHLAGSGLAQAICFGNRRMRFALPERFDVKTMLRPEVMLLPLLSVLASGWGVPFRIVPTVRGAGASFTNGLRRRALRVYKMAVLTRRVHQASGSSVAVGDTRGGVLTVIRAASELTSAMPVLRELERQGVPSMIFADDLVKNPDGTAAVSRSGFAFIRAPSLVRLRDIVRTVVRDRRTRRGVLRDLAAGRPNEPGAHAFFLTPGGVRAVLSTMLDTLPELRVFALQLVRCCRAFRPTSVLTLDTIDRWGAVVGEVGRRLSTETITLQNTALDHMSYPQPLATSELFVANGRLRDAMIASGADPGRVHAVGLPLHDALVKAGNGRVASAVPRGRLRVLIATQPFVQDFDYNGDLIEAVTDAVEQSGVDAVVSIKPHPREDISRYQGITDRTGTPIPVTSESLERLWPDVDVLISRTSTVLQSALVAGVVPVSYLHRYPREVLARLDYLQSDAVAKAFTPESLCEALSSLAADRDGHVRRFAQARAGYLRAYCGSDPGCATSHVVARLTASPAA